MCILDLSNVLMYKFHYEDFSKDKGIFDFSYYSAKPKYYDVSNKLVVGKMKDETDGVAITEFVGLKPKSFLVHDSTEHKKGKGANTNVANIDNNE